MTERQTDGKRERWRDRGRDMAGRDTERSLSNMHGC